MGLFNFGDAFRDTLGNFMQEDRLKNQLGGTDLNNDPMKRAQMARQLEGVQKQNQSGFMSQLGDRMMANARQNIGMGGVPTQQPPMIGAMGAGPQGQPGLGGIAAPQQQYALDAMQAAGKLPMMNSPQGQMMMGRNNMLQPIGDMKGLLGALNVDENQKSAKDKFLSLLMGGMGG